MGTLTATAAELPSHCPHKLPTSCRLTATPTCCACQDSRPHSAAYATYVDGVGLVQRGTRFQRYCWFCKEFWQNRLNAVQPPIDPKHTRIPADPDQSEFIAKWFEYYRGYRMEKDERDGSERRVEVKPEKSWIDVAPGELPVLNEQDRIMASRRELRAEESETREYVSLDSIMDELLDDANAEASGQSRPSRPSAAPAVSSASSRRTAMQPPSTAETEELANRLREAQRLVNEADAKRKSLADALREAEVELRTCRENKARLTRERNTRQHLARVFGTMEEMERQGANYVSPLTDMFNRAYDRYNVAEEVRQEARLYELNEVQQRQLLQEVQARELQRLGIRGPSLARLQPAPEPEQPVRTLDDLEDQRPPPMSEAQMTVKLDCKICLQQRADTAVLPCGHLIMCMHCADIAVPTRKDDATTPIRRNSQCPFCRKTVKRVARVYTA